MEWLESLQLEGHDTGFFFPTFILKALDEVDCSCSEVRNSPLLISMPLLEGIEATIFPPAVELSAASLQDRKGEKFL